MDDYGFDPNYTPYSGRRKNPDGSNVTGDEAFFGMPSQQTPAPFSGGYTLPGGYTPQASSGPFPGGYSPNPQGGITNNATGASTMPFRVGGAGVGKLIQDATSRLSHGQGNPAIQGLWNKIQGNQQQIPAPPQQIHPTDPAIENSPLMQYLLKQTQQGGF